MKRILKGFFVLAMLVATSSLLQAVCGPSGCGQSALNSGAPCGTCGIVGTKECSQNQVCDDQCLDRCCDGLYYCKSHFSPRSQGLDGARRLAGQYGTHLADKDEVYFTFDAVLEYQRTFNWEKLGKYFSPRCGSNCFTIGADSQTNVDVRNQDFGYNGTAQVCFCPYKSEFIADFYMFAGLNEWLEGLYMELEVPIAYSVWKSNCCVTEGQDAEDIENWTNDGVTILPNLMAIDGDAVSADDVGTTSAEVAVNGQVTWGDVQRKMCFAKMCCDKQSKTRVADIRYRLGYDFWLKENYHFGLKAIIAAPTGNKPEAYFMFEPIVGNGGHWELGGGLNAHAILWDKDEDKTFGFHFDTEITHMFKTDVQRRTFDLAVNGCFSRYLLLKKFTNNGTAIDTNEALVRGPNVFTQDVKVRFNVQTDITAFFRVKYNNWMVDFGWDGWFRSYEKLYPCWNIPEKTYGIKGILDMGDQVDQTASRATMPSGTDKDGDVLTDGDDPEFIDGDGSDLNLCSASHPGTSSQTVFTHVSYIWEDIDWEPVVGIGGKAEMSSQSNTAFDQWAIWARGSISF